MLQSPAARAHLLLSPNHSHPALPPTHPPFPSPQVAKALIDQAAKAGMTAPPPPPATGAAAALGSAEGLGALLDWRERMLTAGLAGELAAAGRGGADAANAAFDDALDRVVSEGKLVLNFIKLNFIAVPNRLSIPCPPACPAIHLSLHRARPLSPACPLINQPTNHLQVLLGWAKTDSWSYATLAFEAARTPAALRPALSLLCQLYGLSRVEAGAECYLSTGASGRVVWCGVGGVS